MNPRLGRALALVRAVVAAARQRDVGFLAAGVAYYAFVSLVPLALLGFAAASTVGNGTLTGSVRTAVDGLLAPEGQELLTSALAGEDGRGGATVVGTLVLLWSGSRVLRGLDRAFSQVYETGQPEPLTGQLRDAALVLGAVLLGVVGMGVVGALVTLVPLVPSLRGVGVLTLWLTLVVAFLPMYTVFPDVQVSARAALPGAVLAATSFAALGSLFGLYTAVAGNFALYGVLGAVLLVVTWLYFGATLLMVGAVLNAVLAGQIGTYRERAARGGRE